MARPFSIPEGPLTQQRLRTLLHYDRRTGVFTNKVARGSCPVGKVVGSKNKVFGYLIIVVDRVYYYAHRLAWFYVKGEWPKEEIDHRNRVRHDNRWKNLREASRKQQAQNEKMRSNNTSGYKGVTKTPSGMFHARIRSGERRLFIGAFATAEEAGAAYIAAKRVEHTFHPGD